MNIVIAFALAVVAFFGGTSATVYAAQDSLPDQGLYPVKLWIEDSLLALTISPPARLSTILDFADRRVAEMQGLVSAWKPVPE